jgi:Ni/Fe-hydrogenase subunit HybB-like protein
VLAVVVALLYALATNQFVGLLMLFRDAATVAYIFLLRIAVPIILIVGIGGWLERKLNPGSGGESRPITERVPWLARFKVPKLSPGQILAFTFVAALWVAGIGITIGRFFFGLGYVTNMNDTYPWGLWLAFDMITGVPLAAGGFVLAGVVYVFNLKRFHPIVRPAILTAFLGYMLAIVGLLFDLGRWYNVWHAMIMWNLHSPLIEVAWCVMTYTTVLALEFSPVVFERFHMKAPLNFIRKITIPLVIFGMCLSTLHQSTLGTLFLIFPEKMNPLWYSPFLPVFFFISAIAVGIGMVIIEANLSARAFHRELEHSLLRDLGKVAAVVLVLYTALKIYDLITRGAYVYLTVPGFHSALYWIEVSFGVIIPMAILATRRGRENPRALFASSGLIVFGVVMNRLNTVLLGWWNYTNGGPIYVPSLAEITGSIFLISVGVVAFGLISKYFPIFEDGHGATAPAQ